MKTAFVDSRGQDVVLQTLANSRGVQILGRLQIRSRGPLHPFSDSPIPGRRSRAPACGRRPTGGTMAW